MNVLVTGACGRIGSHVIRRLVRDGVDVVGADSAISAGNLRELATAIEVAAVDIRDLASLLHLIREREVSHVVHLAAVIGRAVDQQPWLSYSVNLGGTINVLEAARLAGVKRVVMASTHSVYIGAGEEHGPPTWRPVDEEQPTEAKRPYVVMKLASEQMGRIFARQHGVDFAAVRFSSYFGAERALRRGSSLSDVLNRLIMDAVEGKPVRLPRGADQVFDPVYIKDCAHGVVCALTAERALDGRVYNIGGGRPVALHEAAEAVRSVVPDADIEIGPGLGFVPDGSAVDHLPWLDIARARREIGYEPQYTLETGIRDAVTELRSITGAPKFTESREP